MQIRKHWAIFVCILVLLLFGASMVNPSLQNSSTKTDWTYPSGFAPHGPFIDRLTLRVRHLDETPSWIQFLQVGYVYAWDESISHHSLPELEAYDNLEVSISEGLEFRHFVLNTQRFPTNITGYRQALAHALNKHSVIQAAEGGYAVPMDGVIPLPLFFWTYENQMTSHYYDEDISSANATLDAAHIIDTPDSPHPGWRYFDADLSGNWTEGIDKRGDLPAPDGLSLELLVSSGWDHAIASATVQKEGMEKCGLHGEVIQIDYDALFYVLVSGVFNLACFSWLANPPGDPEWLYSLFHSQSLMNLQWMRYNSSAFDYNVSKMLTASTKLESRAWAWNCSQLLLQDMPMITCYNRQLIHAYRTDIWDGYVNMTGQGITGNNPWSVRKVHLKAEYGGPINPYSNTEYLMGYTEGMTTTNVLLTDDRYTQKVFDQIYSHLWQTDPYTLERVPDLAYSWIRENTWASGDIQTGEKYTFNLYENITWHDGTPFTATDVTYSLDAIWSHSPYHSNLVEHIYRIDTPNDHTVEIYTNQSGYFEFTKATSPPILPKHIWELHDNYTAWEPESPSDLTGTGPFRFIDKYQYGDWVILDRFTAYHLGLERPPLPPFWLPPWIMIVIIIGVPIILIQASILVHLFYRRRKHSKQTETTNTE